MEISSNTNYSARGNKLAETYYNAAKKTDGSAWKTKRNILKDGFDAITKSPETTEFEKTLAKLGKKVGSHYMDNSDATKARYVVMNAISNSIGGAMGAVIARVTYDAAKDIDGCQWDDKRAVLKDGFDTIRQNPDTSGDEKALAELGIDVGNDYMADSDAAKARYEIMKVISGSTGGPIGQVLASATYNAAKGIDGSSWKSKRAILKSGFEAIMKNPDASEEAKILAKQGIEVGDDYMANSDAAKARYSVMEAIINQE